MHGIRVMSYYLLHCWLPLALWTATAVNGIIIFFGRVACFDHSKMKIVIAFIINFKLIRCDSAMLHAAGKFHNIGTCNQFA